MLGPTAHRKEYRRRAGLEEEGRLLTHVLAQSELPGGCPSTVSSEVNEPWAQRRDLAWIEEAVSHWHRSYANRTIRGGSIWGNSGGGRREPDIESWGVGATIHVVSLERENTLQLSTKTITNNSCFHNLTSTYLLDGYLEAALEFCIFNNKDEIGNHLTGCT